MKIIENTMESYEGSKQEGYGSMVSGLVDNQRICFKVGTLAGSERQIEWADSIKHGWIRSVVENQEGAVRAGVTTKEKALGNVTKIISILEQMTDAKEIIEMRTLTMREIVKKILER